jgi:bifunctional non-homologous end joining protein LigD
MHFRPGVTRPALSSLDKVMWPAVGFSKGQMLDYYERIAPVLVPHLLRRPLTLGRFPNGVEAPGFAQTECRGKPEWMETAVLRLRDGRVRRFCLVDGVDSLLWVANLSAVELHVFLGLAGSLAEPTAVLFDLDPEPPAGLLDACRVAVLVREWLAAAGLSAVVKTTGGSGLHVLVPLNSPHTYSETRDFARRVASELAATDDRIAPSAGRRALRRGTVLIDWAQNNERRSMVAPYSLRASVAPSVSAPVTWEEVEAGVEAWLGPDEVLERVDRLGDPFEAALSLVQRVPPASTA